MSTTKLIPSAVITKAMRDAADELVRLQDENSRLRALNAELLAALKVAQEFFINPGKFNPLEVEQMYEAAIQHA